MRTLATIILLGHLALFSPVSRAADAPQVLSQQVERLSTLLADPSLLREERSARIVQRMNFGGLGLVVVVFTFSAVGGTGYEQTLALFESSPGTPEVFVLSALLNHAGVKGTRSITRVLPDVSRARSKSRFPSFEVEATDENTESDQFGKTIRVRFEFQFRMYVRESTSQ